jgi:putative Ca2+/H+ antiporter (TMEM165/GDT1 family)
MESLFVATGVVALAEIGDKTQLLAFLLAARFKKPVPIVFGILAATLVNHGLAGAAGAWLSSLLSPLILRWTLGLSFLAMAVWMLVPDQADDLKPQATSPRNAWGIFGATFTAFFLAEMGDKTQAATVALAAHYGAPLLVIAGTTLGMLLADVPAVFVGGKLAERLPLAWLRGTAAVVFGVLGGLTLTGIGASFGI